MSREKSNIVYMEIATGINSFINSNGKDVYLCVNSEYDEMIEGRIYVNNNGEYKRYDDLIDNDNEADNKYWDFLDLLTCCVKRLKKLFMEEKKGSFTSLKIRYSKNWEVLSVEYGFELLSDYDEKLLNEIVWEYKTLNMYPTDKEEKEMLEKFLKQKKM